MNKRRRFRAKRHRRLEQLAGIVYKWRGDREGGITQRQLDAVREAEYHERRYGNFFK